MKQIKYFLDLLLFSNIFISFCAAGMTVETFFILQAKVNWFYVTFVFSSTLVLYNFPTFFEKNFLAEYSQRHKWISESRKTILTISILGLIPACILVFFFSMKFILWFIPVAIIALAYFFPQTQLRGITGLKTCIVAFVWCCITALFPLLLLSDFEVSFLGEYNNVAVLLQNFFFIFPLCIIYNVRDIEVDRKAGVKTLPVVLGVKATIAVCLTSLVLFSVLVILSPSLREDRSGLLLSGAISVILVLFASEKSSDYYYSLWIDGMILLQAGVVYLLHFFNL